MKERSKPARYIELIDDIYNHVFQWASDQDWNTLPPKVNVALVALMNELKVAKALKEVGQTDLNENSLQADKRRFIALFKKKHLERFDMKFTDSITPINQVNIARVIKDLKDEGGKYEEFIEWFFDDICSLEQYKSMMPPEINFMCSNHIVKKYLYKMKDTLKMRQQNISREETRTILLEIALPLQKRINNQDFAQKIIDFDNQKISATKFFSIMKIFAKQHNDLECLLACDKISAKAEELKKFGI